MSDLNFNIFCLTYFEAKNGVFESSFEYSLFLNPIGRRWKDRNFSIFFVLPAFTLQNDVFVNQISKILGQQYSHLIKEIFLIEFSSPDHGKFANIG